MKRNRLRQLLLIAITIAIGISIKLSGTAFSEPAGDYIRDALWALMVYWIAGFIFPSKPAWWVALSALLFSYGIELSQLYHAAFIDSLRSTFLGGLILGYGFVWSDMLCYTVGVLAGVLLEFLFYPNRVTSI
jgi:hypothetical protein